MSQILFALSLLITLIMITGCSGPENNDHSLRDLAFNRNAKNVAILVGAPTNLPGIDRDLNMMSDVLSAEGGSGAFSVRKSWRQSAADVVEATRSAAMEVGEDGTLFFFFSGHGAQNGLLLAESGGMINFDKITAAIRESRSTPLKRFMVFVDACFSGNLVNGTVAVGRDEGPNATVVALTDDFAAEEDEDRASSLEELSDGLTDSITDTITQGSHSYAASLTEQLLVVSAANRSTTSLAGGDGSTFTKGVFQAFRDMKNRSGTTIRAFLQQVHANTRRNSGGHHTPVYRVFPEREILDDLLVGSSNQRPGDGGSEPGSETPPITPPDVQVSIDSDVAVALSTSDANGASQVYLAGRAGLRKLMVCRGVRDACITAPVAATDFFLSQKVISGRVVYESAKLALPENEVFTVLGIGQDGKIASAASFKAVRKQ